MNSAVALIERLAAGWTPAHTGTALEFVRFWGERLEAVTEVKDAGADALHFVTDLSDIHLRGMDEIHCFLLGGSQDDLKKDPGTAADCRPSGTPALRQPAGRRAVRHSRAGAWRGAARQGQLESVLRTLAVHGNGGFSYHRVGHHRVDSELASIRTRSR